MVHEGDKVDVEPMSDGMPVHVLPVFLLRFHRAVVREGAREGVVRNAVVQSARLAALVHDDVYRASLYIRLLTQGENMQPMKLFEFFCGGIQCAGGMELCYTEG